MTPRPVAAAGALVPVVVADLPAVAALIDDVLARAVDATPDEKAAFRANIARNLAWWPDHAASCVHLKFVADDTLAGVVLVKEFWNLCHLFVAPAWHGRGVGRRLVLAAVAACRGRTPRAAIRVNAARNAVGFYARLGFLPLPDAPPPHRGVAFELPLDAVAP